MSSWDRMNKVIERYERLAMGQVRELKQLQRKIIDHSSYCEDATRNQVFQMEEQLVSGLQQLMALRSDLEIADQETFDMRIEPIRKQIQSLVAMNKQLPTRTSCEDTKAEEELNPYEMEGKRYLQQVDSRTLEARARVEEAKSMAEATKKLNKDMQDIEEIFSELATIVHQQHDVVDSIEEQVERAAQETHRGHQELKKAVKYKNAKAPVVAAVIGGLAIGGPVGVAAGSAIAGVAAGVGGLVAGRMSVLIETTLGDLVVDLFVKERPKSSLNFLKLCKMKYYNLCQFHSIEQNYVAQTGDPSGTGRGGESVFVHMYGEQGRFFEREDLPKMRHTRMGIVSFVNNGENMLGSQFYITLGDGLDFLDAQHTIFGQVTEGLDTLEKLNEELCDDDKHPFRDIRISHTVVLHDPFDDDNRLEFPPRSPSPTLEMLTQSNKIAIDENIDEDEGKTAEEIAKEIQDREMAEQAQILEMVGDLRSADEAPPDNVLFVCKLNPVTTDEDLETIFSRFGKIISCEVIRDRRTHDSLQYAFIEFEEPKSCEQAFYKMDNVLIDDRRIHVDFSQSVAKNYKWDKKENSGPKSHQKTVKKEYIHSKPVKREYSPRRSEKNHKPSGRDIRNRSRERDYRRGDADYKRRGDSRERRRSRSPPRKHHEKRRRSRSGEKRRRSRSPPRKHSK